MRTTARFSIIAVCLLTLTFISANAQSNPEAPTTNGVVAQDNQTAVPRFVKFSGVLTDLMAKPLSGPVDVTFKLYKQEADEDALWTETQTVEVDKRGRYTVLLGATEALPVELFSSAEARWLGVEFQGQRQQPRTLLVSVPYALKAAEAEKLAGKSASDFVLSENLGQQVRQVIQAQGQAAPQQKQTGTNSTANPGTLSPGPKFPPSTFSGTTRDQIVLVRQNGSGAGLVATSPQNNAVSGHSIAGSGVLGLTDSTTGGSGVVGVATSNSTSSFQNGVIGVNAGAGAGVAGIATNPSAGVGVYGQSASFAGVFGQTTSMNVHGVAGIANATTGFANGVFGQSASITGTGVFGNATSTNGQATGVYGQTVNWVGVGGQALATSGGPAYGVWGDSVSTEGAGVAGFEDATSGSANGVFGQSVSPDGVGVLGFNNSSSGGTGVRGIASAATGNTSGVFGQNASSNGQGVLGVSNAANGGVAVNGFAAGTTGNAYGVMGTTSTTDFGAGVIAGASTPTGSAFGVFAQIASPNGSAVFAHASSPSGGVGVVGFTEGSNSVAGQFVAHAGSGLLLQGLSGNNFNQVFSLDASGNLHIVGNLTVDGTKSSTAKLQNGREVTLYAVESPENWFEDFGSAELKSGVAWVALDGPFGEATNSAVTYHVFLTADGDSNGLYVSRKTPAGFEVREHGGATSSVVFDYRIVVRRRGYETIRMAEVRGDLATSERSRQQLTFLANSGNLKKTGVINAPRIAPVTTIRPTPMTRPAPRVPQLPKLNVVQPPQPR